MRVSCWLNSFVDSLRLLGPLLLFVLLPACISTPWQVSPAPDAERLARVLAGDAVLGSHWQPEQLPEDDLFSLTFDMKAFAEQAVAGKRSRFQRAQALHHALVLPVSQGGRGLKYSAFVTNTPQQAFLTGDVNCVSFTFLYVAMAQHLGLDAQVNEVDVPPSWDLRKQEAFLFLRHINAKVRLGLKDNAVLDLEMDRYSVAYPQRLISRERAAAQYYNNRGMEVSADGDHRRGFLYLRKALVLDERQSYIWSNMGTLYRRLGLFEDAEAAYLQGLQLDAKDLTIISNLSGLYSLMGRAQDAERYFRRAEQHRAGNPYYRYSQAYYELEAGRPESALVLLQKSLRQNRNEPRFYELAETIYRTMGDDAKAEQMRARAESLRVITFR